MAATGLPKYRVIADELRARIESGELTPGERLPSQHLLAEEAGVTVMTLRQALASLESDGLVRAERGRGTFVSEPGSVRFGIDHLGSFADEMRDQGLDVRTEVLGVSHDVERDTARRALDAEPSTRLTEIARRRFVDDRPVVIQRSIVTSAAWEAIADTDLAVESLYTALARTGRADIARASESFRAIALDSADAAMLDSETSAPALESQRTSFASDGVAFLYDTAVMLGAATEIHAERTPDGMRLGYGSR